MRNGSGLPSRWEERPAHWRRHQRGWWWAPRVGGVGMERGGVWFAYPSRSIEGGNALGPYVDHIRAQNELELLVALDDVERKCWQDQLDPGSGLSKLAKILARKA